MKQLHLGPAFGAGVGKVEPAAVVRKADISDEDCGERPVDERRHRSVDAGRAAHVAAAVGEPAGGGFEDERIVLDEEDGKADSDMRDPS